MTPEDRRTILLVIVLSLTSIAWALFSRVPYWLLLSSGVLVWAFLEAHGGQLTNSLAARACAVTSVFVPAVSLLLGPLSGAPLEILFSPVLCYSLSLWIISSALRDESRCTPGTRAFLTFMMSISIGTLGLLSLYYLDSILFTDLLPTNSALMWPLSSLLFGSLAISIALRATGMEEAVVGSREAGG